MLFSDKKNAFIIFLIISLIFYRSIVYFRGGEVSVLRGLTGLQIHHYHYGVLLMLAAVILFLFGNFSYFTVAVAGFGLGAMLDGFISSLFYSTTRAEEIINYNSSFLPTVIFFCGIILIILLGRKDVR